MFLINGPVTLKAVEGVFENVAGMPELERIFNARHGRDDVGRQECIFFALDAEDGILAIIAEHTGGDNRSMDGEMMNLLARHDRLEVRAVFSKRDTFGFSKLMEFLVENVEINVLDCNSFTLTHKN